MRSFIAALVAFQVVTQGRPGPDPFAFFRPTVHLSQTGRDNLGRGEPVVSLLQAGGHEVGAFTAIPVGPGVTIERAAAWMRRVELLRENRYVLASQRLSSPPQLSDFDRLVLDDEDLDDIRRCSPGRCGLTARPPSRSFDQYMKASASGPGDDVHRGHRDTRSGHSARNAECSSNGAKAAAGATGRFLSQMSVRPVCPPGAAILARVLRVFAPLERRSPGWILGRACPLDDRIESQEGWPGDPHAHRRAAGTR